MMRWQRGCAASTAVPGGNNKNYQGWLTIWGCRVRKGRRWVGLLLGLSMALPVAAMAAPDEAEIKAAFIYNFAKFVEWPTTALASTDTLQICIPDDRTLGGKLGLLQGREAQGHAIRIRTVGSSEELTGCNILFISSGDDGRARLLHNVGGQPVLTISDSPSFAQQGGMIGLFVEANHVQFAVNRVIAEQSGLKLSARMLQMAHIVQSGEQ
jgi:hypothetical protein